MQSNGNMADENFERMQSNGYTGDAKIFERIRSKGTERLHGYAMCQVFLEQILSVSGTYSMHNFAITELIRMLVSENDEW